MEERRQLGKELMRRFKDKSITLPEKGVKKYGEVVLKAVDGEWPVLEVPFLVAPFLVASGSSVQHAAAAEEMESEDDDGEEAVKVKGGKEGGITAVLAILNYISSRVWEI